jgi:hypothetical protein
MDPGVFAGISAEAPSYGVIVRHEGEVGAGAKVPIDRLDSSFLPRSRYIAVKTLIKSIEARECAPEFEYLARDTAAFRTSRVGNIVKEEDLIHHACSESCFVRYHSILFMLVRQRLELVVRLKIWIIHCRRRFELT